jgi:hypothetical protein
MRLNNIFITQMKRNTPPSEIKGNPPKKSKKNGKRKTIDDYRVANEKFEYFLKKIPTSITTKVDGWRCKVAECNQWLNSYFHILRCEQCPKCVPPVRASTKKKELVDYLKINSDSKRQLNYILDYIPDNTSISIEAWKCRDCGYICTTSYNNIYTAKSGCLKCSGKLPKTLIDYKQVNSDRDRYLEYFLEIIPDNSTELILGWHCLIEDCDYKWSACYSNIYNQKHGCPKCAGNIIKKDLKDYQVINSSERKIIYFLDYVPFNTDEKILGWECQVEDCKYIWETAYTNIYHNKTGCPKCSFHIPKTPEDYKAINQDEDRRINYFLNVIPRTTDVSIKGWCCLECDHEWSASYHNVYGGSGCPNCAPTRRKTIEDYREINLDANRKIEYYLDDIPMRSCFAVNGWRCKICNCEWPTSYQSIYNLESGCPNCGKKKTEKKCREIFKKLTGHNFDSCFHSKLVNPYTKRKLQLDGWCEYLGIAWEYQGEQHYRYIEFFHKTMDKLIKQKQRDELKQMMCAEFGIKLFIIPYNYGKDGKSLEEYITDLLQL